MHRLRCSRRPLALALAAGALACSAPVPAWAQSGVAASAVRIASAETPAEAQTAATQWLAETDAGSHGAAWALSGAAFRGAISPDQWQGAARQVLGPLGAVRTREANGSKATRSLPGVPDGEYLILSYLTDFANKAGAIETLTLAREADGRWRVVGYFVR